MADSRVEIVPAYDALSEIRDLFEAYTAMLVAHDPAFQVYLDIQHYEEERLCPAAKYAPPGGRLYLARADDQPAGCIALRQLDPERCEMKRLYVRPVFRGRGIARRLIARIIDDARYIGYRQMLLDTLPFLEDAIRLYRQLGFYDIPCYNDSPMDTTLFMQLDL